MNMPPPWIEGITRITIDGLVLEIKKESPFVTITDGAGSDAYQLGTFPVDDFRKWAQAAVDNLQPSTTPPFAWRHKCHVGQASDGNYVVHSPDYRYWLSASTYRWVAYSCRKQMHEVVGNFQDELAARMALGTCEVTPPDFQ